MEAAKHKWFHSFSFKLGTTFAILVMLATSASLFFVYSWTKPLLLTQMGGRMIDIGRTASYLFQEREFRAIERIKTEIVKAQKENGIVIPPAQLGEYRKTLPDDVAKKITELEDYQYLVSLLRKVKDASRLVPGETAPMTADSEAAADRPTLMFVSLYMPDPRDPDRRVVEFIADSDYDHPEVPAPPGNLLFNNSHALNHVFDGKPAADPDFRFEQGLHILTAAVPLLDKNGVRRAIIGLYYDAQGEVNTVNVLTYRCFAIVGGAVIAVLICSMILAWFLTRDVATLTRGAERVRNRDFTVELDVRRKDELGLLAMTLNDMIHEIRRYACGLEETNSAYEKFVPKQILECLGRSSITAIKLGDQVQRQMTVLFADIRSFTSISESMSPRDNFDFINEYLGIIGPVIRHHHGFIDKYIGDAVMALFPEKPDDAVKAAIEMHAVLAEFNRDGKERGRAAVSIGVGIHRGNLMLGTVGESERMDGTVISDAVNLASRLEGLTKSFGAPIIISDEVLSAIQGVKWFSHRYLGETKVKGKKRSVRIHEVIDGDIADSARRKAITSKEFERGVKAFEKGFFNRAERILTKVLSVHKRDQAARLYLTKAREMLATAATKKKSAIAARLIEVDEERFSKKRG